jgi:hypothetical protein
MATWRKPGRRPTAGLAPAGERGEHWWPVATAIIAVAGLHVALPARYRVQPAWVVPVVLLALLAVLIAGDPGRIGIKSRSAQNQTSLRALSRGLAGFPLITPVLHLPVVGVGRLCAERRQDAEEAGEPGEQRLDVVFLCLFPEQGLQLFDFLRVAGR